MTRVGGRRESPVGVTRVPTIGVLKMMRRVLVAAVSCGLLIVMSSDAAHAQSPPRASDRPTVSPYLDLLRGGDTAFNYHRRVKPEMEWRSATSQNRQSIGQLQQDQTRGESASKLSGTGHASQFQNFSHFYPSRNR